MVAFESLTLAWPWAALALPLPWLLGRWRPAAETAALRVPSREAILPDVATTLAARKKPRLPDRASVLKFLTWLLLMAAALRPQIVDPALPLAASGRDLMLAIDTSTSMATQDMRLADRQVDRMTVAKALSQDFVSRREGDRIGLIVFGSKAFLHTPLTFDLAALRAALASVDVELAGRETALGDAIALATSRLDEYPDSRRVLVLITDGAHNAGVLAPEQAAWLAQRAGLRIFTIGIGATQMRVVTPEGIRIVDPSAGMDEARLRMLAEQTGGQYQRATDVATLADFYETIAALEPATGATGERPGRELYPYPLGAALLLIGWAVLRRSARVSA